MDGSPLSQAGTAASRRLLLADWSALLARSSLAVAGGELLLLVLLALWLGKAPPLMLVLGLVLLAIAATGTWALRRRASQAEALAIWDARAGRHEALVSAWYFERCPARSVGQQLHLERGREVLAAEWPKLAAQLPIPWQHRTWMAPLVLLAAWLAIGWLDRVPARIAISDEARERAAQVAGTLDEKAAELQPSAELDANERKQLEALQQSVHEAAEKMKDLADATPREALSALEERARAAEELAEALGGAGADKLSTEMLDEMDRHADLADLAAALRAQDAEKTAAEAGKLADKLAGDMSLEERKRIADALQKTRDAASEKDKKTEAGKQLSQASDAMQQKKPQQASKHLRDLAQSMARRGQRQRSSRQLQDMARKLRSAGQNVFGRQNSGLERLAQNSPPPGGLQRAGTGTRQISLAQLMPAPPPSGQSPGTPQGNASAAPPGSAAQPSGGPAQQQGQGGQAAQAAAQPGGQTAQAGGAVPVPGSGSQPTVGSGQLAGGGQQSGGSTPIPGTQPGGASAGAAGSAPVPGAGSGQIPVPGQSAGAGQAGSAPGAAAQGGGQGQGAGAGQGAGSGQGAGAGQGAGGGVGAGVGGLQAGSGSAPMGNSPTERIQVARQATVKAQLGKEGPSQVRAVDPQQHTEQAERSPNTAAAEFLKVQEEALADEPLPASRREQVRRYFNALRRQLSENPSENPTESKAQP